MKQVDLIAFDDTMVEGIHSGVIGLSLSSDDPDWNGLEFNVSITVHDNDCPQPKEPEQGRILSCNTTYGGHCVFRCNSGRLIVFFLHASLHVPFTFVQMHVHVHT